MRGNNVSGVDSVDQSLLEDLHGLDEMVLRGRDLKVFRASREFEAVRVSKVRLVRRFYVHEVGVVDRAEASSDTVEFVVSQKLLVDVKVTGSLAVLTFLILRDAFLLVLNRSLLLFVLELYLKGCRCMVRKFHGISCYLQLSR